MTLLVEPRAFKQKIERTLMLLSTVDSRFVYNEGWVKLLYFTAYHESDLSSRRQNSPRTGGGPARGLYQMEFGTHQELYLGYIFGLSGHDNIIRLLDKLSYGEEHTTTIEKYRDYFGNVRYMYLPNRSIAASFRAVNGHGPDYVLQLAGMRVNRQRERSRSIRRSTNNSANPNNQIINLDIINTRFLNALENHDDYATCVTRLRYDWGNQRGAVTSAISDQEMANFWNDGFHRPGTGLDHSSIFLESLADARRLDHDPF